MPLLEWAGLAFGWALIAWAMAASWRPAPPPEGRAWLGAGAALLILGVGMSDQWVHPLVAFACLALGAALWMAGGARIGAPCRGYPGWLGQAAAAGVLAALVAGLHWAVFSRWPPPAEQPLSMSLYFPPRPGAVNDFAEAAYSGYGWAWLLPAGALACLAWARWSLRTPLRLLALAGLWLLALGLKLMVAGLGEGGLFLLERKTLSMNNGFIHMAPLIGRVGAWKFACHFTDVQRHFGWHVDTHPFLPCLVYAWMAQAAHGSGLLVGLWVAAVNAATAPLLAATAFRLTRSWTAAVAAGLLWATSPLSSMLSCSGSDAFAALGVAGLLLAWVLVLEGRLQAWVAGAVLFAASFFSFTVPALPLLLAGWSWSQGRDLRRTARHLLPLVLVPVAGHALLWALSGGRVDYIASMRLAIGVHASMNASRPYWAWSWLNVLLYAGYAGTGLVVAALSAFSSPMGGRGEGFLRAAWLFLLVLVLAALGRAEVERQFLFGGLLMVLASVSALRGLGQRRQRGLMLLWAALGLAHSAVLAVCTVDFW